QNTANIDYVLSGKSLIKQFDNPVTDPRTPDVIVQPVPGSIYTKSAAKVAEHGGFDEDDTHVAMLVVNGAQSSGATGKVIPAPVTSGEVATTILQFLGLDEKELDAVRMEHTRSLPSSPN